MLSSYKHRKKVGLNYVHMCVTKHVCLSTKRMKKTSQPHHESYSESQLNRGVQSTLEKNPNQTKPTRKTKNQTEQTKNKGCTLWKCYVGTWIANN